MCVSLCVCVCVCVCVRLCYVLVIQLANLHPPPHIPAKKKKYIYVNERGRERETKMETTQL